MTFTKTQLMIASIVATSIGFYFGYKKGLRVCKDKPKEALTVKDGEIK